MHKVPADQDILQYVVEFIAERYLNNKGRTRNDLSNLFVLLPHAHVKQQFTSALGNILSEEIPAFIPPWSGTLKNWILQFSSDSTSEATTEKQLINDFSRQLLFIEALQQHPDLFKPENQWQVTQALLKLFDELSLNQLDIFSSEEELHDTLQQAYGIDSSHQHLINESRLVYTLWQAWQQQLDENALIDDTGDYLLRLADINHNIDRQKKFTDYQFICLAYENHTKTEQAFIQKLIDNKRCQLIDFDDDLISKNEPQQKNIFAKFIAEAYETGGQTINRRAQQFVTDNTETDNSSPENDLLSGLMQQIPLSTYLASDEEQQIRAIDIYVRLCILNGKSNIAIISEDRKLSRRLRALLERADVPLQDKAGWSLATTQASTIIERWLECIEQDFNAYPFLDLLKSPFLNISQLSISEAEAEKTQDKEAVLTDYKKNIYRFEHDVIFHENVSSNIKQYKNKLKHRLKRLHHWPGSSYDELINILNFIETTAQPLLQLHGSAKENRSSDIRASDFRASDFLTALTSSLEQLGVLQTYENDKAGIILLDTLEALEQSLQYADPELSWHDCRVWLGMALEAQTFTPQADRTNVQLMTLEQASHLNFDCIIIAACDSKHFPGSAKNSPFFNQAVRASLQLETWETLYQQRFKLFKRTLLAAPDILITACNEEKGEEKPVSPWLELLINFYQLAFDQKPHNKKLQQLVDANIGVFVCDESDLPDESKQTSPALPDSIIPDRVSASAYQRIINCPYQYFSADALQLRALEELSDELKKSDYGERIHFILQIFHNGHARFAEAFADTITSANREQAENYLAKISAQVFHHDLENNVLHRSWLHRWSKHIPAYIDWQIQHQLDWNIYQTEMKMEVLISQDEQQALAIYGRLDRIDRHKENQAHGIIDYKTGRTARQADIDNGENVQLSMYSLLDKDATEVSYLSVDSSNQKVETKSFLAGEALEDNRQQNRKRLLEIFSQMHNAAPMHAWGDDSVCVYCNFAGLCRKAEWAE